MMKRATYPPRVFKCKLPQLIRDHPSKPTIDTVAAAVGVSPPTMRKYVEGGEIPLSIALKLCRLLANGKRLTIEQVWE